MIRIEITREELKDKVPLSKVIEENADSFTSVTDISRIDLLIKIFDEIK